MNSKLLKLFLLFAMASSALLSADSARRFSYPTDSSTLMSAEWQRDFVREPIDYNLKGLPKRKIFCFTLLGKIQTLDLRYLQNHSRAQMNFYDWYLGDSPVSYPEQLRRQHLESALGQPEEKQHYVNISDRISYPSDIAEPGIFRAELLANHAPHLGIDEFQTNMAQWEQLERHGLNQSEAKAQKGAYRLVARDIAENLQAEIEFKLNGRVSRTAPKNEAETAFREAAGKRMTDLKKWRDKSPAEVRDNLNAFLNDLSDYYHTAIQWMPFSAINNSILMGHVNVILRHAGLRTIPHDGLDYLALMSHYDVFRGVFKEAVRHENPAN